MPRARNKSITLVFYPESLPSEKRTRPIKQPCNSFLDLSGDRLIN